MSLKLYSWGQFYTHSSFIGFSLNPGKPFIAIDFLCGFGALALELIYLFFVQRFTYYGNALRFLKIFSLERIRILIAEIAHIIPRSINVLLSIFFVFYIFCVFGQFLFRSNFPQYFGTLSRSMLTMFQILTLDSWNSQIVQPIIKVEGFYSSIFFSCFILIVFYTFLNVFLGIFVSYYSIPGLSEDMSYNYSKDPLMNPEYKRFLENSISYKEILERLDIKNEKYHIERALKIFDNTIYYYWGLSLIFTFVFSQISDNFLSIKISFFVEISFGIIFTLHFCLNIHISEESDITFFSNRRISIPKYFLSIHFLIDLVSGPFALIYDLIIVMQGGSLTIGPLLRNLKLCNTSANQTIIKKLIQIFPRVLPTFVLIFSILYYSAFFATINFKSGENSAYFSNFSQSFLTLIQIMTLDSWGGIARTSINQHSLAPLFFVVFILIVSFFLLNIIMGIVANSSKDITEKIFETNKLENKRLHLRDFNDYFPSLLNTFHGNWTKVEKQIPILSEEEKKAKSMIERFNKEGGVLKIRNANGKEYSITTQGLLEFRDEFYVVKQQA